jgi:cephalosporin hydroxylase
LISIITPWRNNADTLLVDYAAAVQGAQVVIVDNSSDAETAAALKDVEAVEGNVYIRNEKNAGFAAANNQGYAAAAGDIVLFLNSDIAAPPGWLEYVRTDVRDGALYGPSMQYQFVAGRWLPYLEGWCIAATRETWERLKPGETDPERCYPPYQLIGPWDNLNFSGPYWEDNDLCLRAMQAGISLIQTGWPVQHKGGRTAGPLANHAASIEANRATFSRRVRSAFDGRGCPPTPTYPAYMQQVHTQSDIQHHLPLLYSLARGNVVELGTRGGVSTAALLAGVEAHGGHVWSVDIDDCSKVAAGHSQWTFYKSDSRDPALPGKIALSRPDPVAGLDLLLIDTEHRIDVTSAELELWAPYVKPGGTICLHDPETFPGVRRAVEDFCARTGWPVTFVLPCHGMAVIEVPITKDAPDPIGVSLERASWAMEVTS